MKPADESHPFILSEHLLPSISTVPSQSDDQYPPITYNLGRRPYRDLPFFILFILLSLSTFFLGIFSLFHRNPNNSLSSSSCDSRSLSLSQSSAFLGNLIPTILITLLLSFPIAFSLLTLLRHFAKHLVYFSIPFFILIPIFLNIYWFAACQLRVSCRQSFPLAYRVIVLVFVFVVIAVVGWIIVSNWHRVKLTVEILRVAAAALGRNRMLVFVLPCLMMGLVVYCGVIIVFLVFVMDNGRVVGREGGDGVYYCEWRRDGWVPAYFALAIVTMLWGFASVFEAKVYVTSGVIAQWYFFAEQGGVPRGSLRSCLR